MNKESDKALLTVLFLIVLAMVMYLTMVKMDEGSVDWARDTANLILGALLGLITGLSRGNTPKPPSSPPTITDDKGDKP